MPELPEVETVMRGLAPFCEGKRVTRLTLNREGLRFPFPPRLKESVEGAIITRLERRAKYLLFHLDNSWTMLSHLGMSGSFRVENAATATFHHERSRLTAHDHVVMELGDTTLTYNDPRRFGVLDIFKDHHKMLDNVGVEPFSNGLHAAYIHEKSRGRKTPLKNFLLDQSIIAGLGNIYVCEILFLSKLSPFKSANDLTLHECETLTNNTRTVLSLAIEAGGSSLKDHAGVTGELGYFSHKFNVYDRENMPCPACKRCIIRAKQGGRSTFYCESCQK
jgi:formamidopyrimidine-DNA glycosylase